MTFADFTERKQAERRLAAEHAVGKVLAQAEDFTDAAPRVLDAFCTALDVEVAELWLPDKEDRTLRCAAFHVCEGFGDVTAFREAVDRMPRSRARGLPGKVWDERKPAWITDVRHDPDFAGRSEAAALGLQTAFAFPILLGEACLAVMSFFCRRALPPEPPLLEMMAAVGRDLGQFIRWTGAEARLRARVRQQTAAAAISQKALKGAALPELMDQAAALVAETLDVELCKILELLPDGRALLLKAGVGWRPDEIGRETVSAGIDSCAGYTLLAGEPVLVADLATERRFAISALLREHGAVSGLSVVIAGGERRAPYGALGAHTRHRREFTPDDALFLQSVADVLAGAIQRKRAETALVQSEQRLRRILDNLFAFVAVLSPQGAVIDINRAPLDAAGIAFADVSGRQFDDCYWWSYSPQVQAQLRDAMARAAGGEMVRYDVDVRIAGGHLISLDFMIAPLRDEGGEVTGLIPSAVDITERNRLTEERFQAFLDIAPDALILIRSDCTVRFVNEQAERLFGYARSELVGKPVEVLMPERYRERHAMHQKSYFADPNRRLMGRELEIRGQTRHGREIPLEVSISSVAMPEGALALAAARDITDRMEAEQALRVAKEAADAANALKSRFVAAASHDLRQPLQTIGLLGGVLAQTVQDEAGRRVLAQIADQVASMGDVIDSLLDIDRLDTGQIRPEIMRFPIQRLLDRLQSQFGFLAEERGLVLRMVPSSAGVRSDPRLLERLVGNLVSNAIKYTDSGGRVLIGCRRSGGSLRIEIWDTGVGISKSKINKVFEDYHRLPQSGTRAREPGLGLGLAIVKRLGQILEHPIEARSTPGEGSVFAVTVPLEPTTRRDIAPTAAQPSRAEPTRHGVMLVEDETGPRESLRLLLELNGYEVRAAGSASEAMDLVAECPVPPRVIIADYWLSESMTGVGLIRDLREATGWATSAIVLTGDTSLETRREIEGAGCRYLAKPIKPDDLLEVVGRVTRVGGAAPSVPPSRPAPGGAPESAAPAAATVFVIEDNREIREALRSLLQGAHHRVEAFASAEAFLQAVGSEAGRGCVVLDMGLPGMSGLRIQERLKTHGPDLPVVVISGRKDVSLAVKAMRAGALDFLEKPFDPERLLEAVARALADLAPSDGTAPPAAGAEAAARFGCLTPREREVLGLVAEGHANKEVAHRLGLSHRTVENHRARGLQKLGIRSLAELVRLAVAAEAGGVLVFSR